MGTYEEAKFVKRYLLRPNELVSIITGIVGSFAIIEHYSTAFSVFQITTFLLYWLFCQNEPRLETEKGGNGSDYDLVF